MAINVLLVTPVPAVADAIQRSLQDTNTYRVHVVNNKAAAVVRADEKSCVFAILDMNLGESWVVEIGESLRTVQPQIKLVILCQDENPPALDKIRPWSLLRQPVQLTDLLHDMSAASESPTQISTPNIPWLQDVAKAAQHLTRLTLESSAQAALITRNSELWAYAGGLSQSAGKELAQTVARNWDGQKGSDLLRFIRLESTRAEHMLYATRLAPDTVLALVFDAETPFSTIRSQANQLISTLGNEKTDAHKAIKIPEQQIQEAQNEDEDIGVEIPPITDILTDIPTPNPQAVDSPFNLELPAGPMTFDSASGETRPSTPLSHAGVFSRESSPAIPLSELLMADQGRNLDETMPSSSQSLDEVDVTAPSRSKPRHETPIRKPESGELDATRPSPTTEAARRVTLEPVTAGLYHLTYACLLVPRFSSHYLTGDLADRIAEWLPTICVAFGWRLEFLAVRPEYLQWVVNVQPNTSPGYLMRIMRLQTSEKIFAEFPRLKKENPSGDFWAPGYLIMGGTQPHPPQLVRDYIKQTRERQGISHPRK